MSTSHPSKEQHVLVIAFILIGLIGSWSLFRWYQSRSSDDTSNTSADTSTVQNQRDAFITPEELEQRLGLPETAKKTLVIDIRNPKEFQWQHIIGSTNVTDNNIDAIIPKDRPDDFLIVFIGTSEDDASLHEISARMQRDHISATTLRGGFQSWIDASGSYISQGDIESLADASKITIVHAEQAKQAFDKKNTIFIDTRFPESFQAGHIPGALNIPLEQLESRRAEIPFGTPIILYNDAPVPSFQAAVRIFELGFVGTKTLEGGLSAWKDKNYPLEK